MSTQVEARAASLSVELERERETKATVVYQTSAEYTDVPMTKVYVMKWAAAQLGDPDRIVFTLTPVDEGGGCA